MDDFGPQDRKREISVKEMRGVSIAARILEFRFRNGLPIRDYHVTDIDDLLQYRQDRCGEVERKSCLVILA